MSEEFNLSDKINWQNNHQQDWGNLSVEDVKEFIKRLKQEFDKSDGDLFFPTEIKEMIDKLAGEKLI